MEAQPTLSLYSRSSSYYFLNTSPLITPLTLSFTPTPYNTSQHPLPPSHNSPTTLSTHLPYPTTSLLSPTLYPNFPQSGTLHGFSSNKPSHTKALLARRRRLFESRWWRWRKGRGSSVRSGGSDYVFARLRGDTLGKCDRGRITALAGLLCTRGRRKCYGVVSLRSGSGPGPALC